MLLLLPNNRRKTENDLKLSKMPNNGFFLLKQFVLIKNVPNVRPPEDHRARSIVAFILQCLFFSVCYRFSGLFLTNRKKKIIIIYTALHVCIILVRSLFCSLLKYFVVSSSSSIKIH